MTSRRNFRFAIVGAGPAGLSLAAEACRQGHDVVVVAPDPGRIWTQGWSSFEDELPGIPVLHRWTQSRYVVPSREIVVDRPYVSVDGPALQRALQQGASEATFVDSPVLAFDSGILETTEGSITAEHVIDCSGAAQVLGSRGPAAGAFQTAYGLEFTTDAHPWDPAVATLMDFRDMAERPSFLYAMPMSHQRVFLEETALAARPALPIVELERRLRDRLSALGVHIGEVRRTERCSIPLDVPKPTGLAFGTAGGMVHPATGYLLARVLDRAAPFIDALAAQDPAGAMALTRLPGRGLHRFGLDMLTTLDNDELTHFFTLFFEQPRWVTDAFLARDPTLPSTVLSMLRIFFGAPNAVRRLLIRPLHMEPSWPTRCAVN